MKKILFLFAVFLWLSNTSASASDFEYRENVPPYTGEVLGEVMQYSSLADFVSDIISGRHKEPRGIIQRIVNMVAGDVKGALSYVATVMGLVILSSCIKGSQINLGKGVSEIAFLVCYFVVATFLVGILYRAVTIATEAAEELEVFIRMSLPAYIGVVSATRTNAAASQGIFLVMVNVVSRYAGQFMVNSFFYIGVLTVISNMSSEIHITKLVFIARQILFWVLGFILTVFAGLTALSGLSIRASSATGIRAAKYTIGHAIPVVGGFLADSTELILASAKIFKNAFGTAGILIMAVICLVPVLKLFVIGFALKITSGLTEPFCDKLMSDGIYGVGQTIIHIMVCILLMTVMFIMAFAVLLNL